jgi:hypothetical protein
VQLVARLLQTAPIALLLSCNQQPWRDRQIAITRPNYLIFKKLRISSFILEADQFFGAKSTKN